MKRIIALVFLAAVPAGPGVAAEPTTPQEEAMAVYTAYLRLHPTGMPGARTRRRLQSLMTRHLNALLSDGKKAEARYAKATKNEVPPLVEGDLFTSLFEGATAYRIGTCMSEGAKAVCTVDLTYKDTGQPDFRWTDSVVLLREGGRYRLDDVIYGGNWAFGNKGTLSELVSGAIANSSRR